MPLVERFMTLIYIEPIGTGASGRLADPRGYTLARYVRQVDGLLDHLGVGPVHFLGHSYGGFVTLRYALEHPARLASLIRKCGAKTPWFTDGDEAPRAAWRRQSFRTYRLTCSLLPSVVTCLHTAGPAGIDACGGGFGPRHDGVRLARRASSAVVSPRIPRLQPWGAVNLYDSSPTSGQEFWERVQGAVGVFAERHRDQPELPDVLAALQMIFTLLADPHATDEGLTSVFRCMIPVYFADYWARESEFAPLREAIRMYANPQRGVESAPYDVRGQLGAISTRTLAMVGRYDAICVPYWSEMLAEKMPNAHIVMLEQSGHFGHVEEPEAFARAASAFVR